MCLCDDYQVFLSMATIYKNCYKYQVWIGGMV